MGAGSRKVTGALGMVVLAVLLARPASADDRPGWFDNPPTSPTQRFFVGSADDAPSENAAIENARKAAMARLAESFGQHLDSTTTADEAVENGQTTSSIRVKVTSRSRPLTIGEVRDPKRHAVEDRRGRWSGWALVAIPEDEYQRVKTEIARLLKEQGELALQKYRRGETGLREGKACPAVEEAREALALAQDLDPLAPLSDPDFKKVSFLIRAAESLRDKARDECGRARNTVAIHLTLDVDGDPVATKKASDPILADLTKQAAAAGLKAVPGNAAAAAWVLEVQAEASLASEIYGQFFAQASGTWRLVESASGRELAAGDLGQNRGGHVRRADSCLRALGPVRTRLMEAVGPAFRKAAEAGRGSGK